MARYCWCLCLWAAACGVVVEPSGAPAQHTDEPTPVPDDTPSVDTDGPHDSAAPADTGLRPSDPFADRVVRFDPGPDAGFGQAHMPGVVLGPPRGGGPTAGSLDVVSLGEGGSIVLALDDLVLIDGPGVDLLVFENPFPGFQEVGEVSVSDDGVVWHTWACDAHADDLTTSGCAGVQPVLAHADEPVDPTDPLTAGGDGFDLADLGLSTARFVRVTDARGPRSWYGGTTGGFDLDAVAVVHGAPASP